VDKIFNSIAKREAAKAEEPTDFGDLVDPWDKHPVPTLPKGILPPVIERYAAHEARTKGVQFHGPAMTALAVAAAAVPAHVHLRVKVHEAWEEACILWLALIGPVSARKSPLLRTAMRALKRAEDRARVSWDEEKRAWEKLPEDDRGPVPVQARYVVNDVTVEKVGNRAVRDPKSSILSQTNTWEARVRWLKVA
jgi:hypothetical protein